MPGTDVAGHASPGAPDAVGLEIRVLGPLELAWESRTADVGGVKARALVARLLIDRGLAVSVDRLVDSLWGAHEGAGAEIALRSTISRVRKRLRDAGAPEDLIVDARTGVPPRRPGPGDRRPPVRRARRRGPSAPRPAPTP